MPQATEISDVRELAEGDTVTLSGNGVDTTRDVADVGENAWSGGITVQLEGTDFAYRLSNNDVTGGIALAGVGCVSVRKHN